MFRSIAALAGASAVLIALSACAPSTAVGNPSTSPVSPDNSATSVSPSDPLELLKGPDSGFTVDTTITPAVHQEGTGPGTVEVDRPDNNVGQLDFYLTCSPDSDFTVTMVKWYSGPCTATSVVSSGGIPLPTGTGPLSVSIDVPAGTHYWLLAIPIQK